MKRLFFLLFIVTLTFFTNVYASNRITIKGVEYEVAKNNTATATLTVMAKDDVVILDNVTIGKKQYLVTEIKQAYFKKNSKITGVELPKSLKTIRSGAFRGCINLTQISFPNGVYTIEKAAFEDCESISTLTGNLKPFLEYRNNIGNRNTYSRQEQFQTPKFSTFANDKLKERMILWQQKKDYETMDQYSVRVTDENRRKRMDEFIGELEQEYINTYAPDNLYSSLGYYDSEYSVFTIKTLYYGNVFAQVSKADAAKFREDFHNVQIVPQFGVKGDTLSLTSCQFLLAGKTYNSAETYSGSGIGNYAFELPALDMTIPSSSTPVKVDNAVDRDIPEGKFKNKKTFAVIIGNEQYKRLSKVPFAKNDAQVFAEYCIKTLGLPVNNVKVYLNAGLNDMRHAVTALANTLKAYDGEARAIVYYAGHGIPDESTHMPYLLPVDGFANDLKSGYSLENLYNVLSAAPSQMTMILLDACFSGAKREGDMLAEARTVVMEAEEIQPEGNLVVFSASQGNQTAYSDSQHGHGLFTYYLLKHLQETKGETTLKKLTDNVITNVKRSSVSVNDGKIQTPTVIPSQSLEDIWQTMKLR